MFLVQGRRSPGEMTRRYRLFRRLALILGRILWGFDVVGAQRTPERGPLVIAANHQRFFDPVFVCMAVPRRVQWMAKKELFVPGLRRLWPVLGAFPVDRQGGARSALRAALEHLSGGWALGIFPEGTRRRRGGSPEAKSGAILLAARSGAPVLPVFVEARPGLLARLRGVRCRAYVGDPITLDRALRGREAYRRAADELIREIYALPEKNAPR